MIYAWIVYQKIIVIINIFDDSPVFKQIKKPLTSHWHVASSKLIYRYYILCSI